MPKIQITECDLTGVVQPSQISNTVFVPIQKATDDSTTNRATFALVNSVSALDKYLGVTSTTGAYGSSDAKDLNGDMGYKLCKHLINVGLDVLVSVVDSVTSIDWDSLADKGLYDIRFITFGTFDPTSAAADAKKCAVARGDCTVLLNLPIDYSYSADSVASIAEGDGDTGSGTTDSGTEGSGTAGDGGDEGSGTTDSGTTGSGTTGSGTTSGTTTNAPSSVASEIRTSFETMGADNGEYCACFAPNFMSLNSDLCTKTRDTDKSVTTPITRDVYKYEEAQVPAAFGYLFAYAAAIKNNPEWYAIAGFQRGFIPELSDVCYELSTAEMLYLQCRDYNKMYELDTDKDNVGAAINPIANIRPAGYIIYGNRTFRYNDAAKKTTAQSFLNVRNMVSGIKKKLWDASRKFTFEPNNELLWIKFKSFVTPYLDQLQAGNGIIAYKFDRLTTTAKARLKCRLVIIPVEAVEDFEIDITLADDLTVVE